MEMTITVGEFRKRLNSIFHDIIPESVAKRCLKEISKFKGNQDFNKNRIVNKDSVDKLLEQICQMQNMPFHKIQTIVRKSTPEAQLFLLERIVTLDNWYETRNQDEIISIPNDFAKLIRSVLIELWADKMQEIS